MIAIEDICAGIVRFLAVVSVMLLCGCMTPYVHEGPSSESSLGYNERKFSDDIYHVWASVNEYHDVSYTYTLRRCAELALEHKYRYFVLMTKDNRQSVFREVDDEFLRRVFHGEVMWFLPNQDVPDVLDAVSVVLKTDAVAKRRLSRKARQNMIELSKQKSN